MTTSPVLAQTAKKATAAGADPRKAAVAVKAEPKKAQGKNASKIFDLKTRSVNSGIREARRNMPAPGRTVLKAAGDMPELYGSIIYSDNFVSEDEVGLYKLPRSADDSPELLISGVAANSGGVCVDGIYYTTSYINFFGIILVTVDAYDMESMEQVNSYSSQDLSLVASGGYALDPTDNSVYCITFNAQGKGRQISKLSFVNCDPTATAVGALAG
ncbi:MAG: hypothetical protein K2L57_05525, partial [Muribaculaceae bacterium]|nr:hypothetical protein [Muribaculaceae bacterium]